jgi:hypothetical protein
MPGVPTGATSNTTQSLAAENLSYNQSLGALGIGN